MGRFVHFVKYEVVERTPISGDVIGTTSCGMVANDEIVVSPNMEHATCLACITNNK
jgi:hypothetical protein